MTIDIVAEIGVNWRGDFDVLERMIERCKGAGLTAVKFQSLGDYWIERHPELPYMKSASLNANNIDKIDKLCKKYNIEWFSTPSRLDAVEMLDPYVKRFKIWHGGQEEHEIINACVKTGKEIIMSTSRPPEVKLPNTKYVYAIPKYPTEYGEINFEMIRQMDGYSNHCLDPLAILKAVRMGAKYIEFHLTDSHDEFALDNKVSMSYAQMDEIMEWITMWEI